MKLRIINVLGSIFFSFLWFFSITFFHYTSINFYLYSADSP